MKYVIGVDGGGTKTQCVIAAVDGTVLGAYKTGCTNPYISGIEQSKDYIAEAVKRLIDTAGVSVQDIQNVHMGLAGADSESDIQLLRNAFDGTLLNEMPYEIQNDIWIAYKAGSVQDVGAVSVCGTGHNTGVLAPGKQKISIKSYRYPLGNFGGGRMIADMALNEAFRSYEFTGDKTMLEDSICSYCGYESMRALAEDIMRSGYTMQYCLRIPKLVIDLAMQGDAVAQRILHTVGWEQGRMTGGLIEKCGLTDAVLPVVLSGTIYVADESGYLLKSYENSVKRYCPQAVMHLLNREPVQGALICAIERSSDGFSPDMLLGISRRINETLERFLDKGKGEE